MNKVRGYRGKGKARFEWVKDSSMRNYPLLDDHIYKLDELAQLRARLFDGKERSQEKLDEMYYRQECLVEMLGIDGVLVYLGR